MTQVVREVLHTRRASPTFTGFVLATLAIAGAIGLTTVLMPLLGGVMGMAHFTEASHRTHDLTYGLLFATGNVGVLVQLRRPRQNVAGMLIALIPWIALLLAAVLSTDAGVAFSAERILPAALTVTVARLHPARRALFRSFSVSRVSLMMLALVGVAAVPLLAFASSNIRMQRTVPDLHAEMGHYGFMAAFSFTVIAVGVLASLRTDGWRVTAWIASLLPAVLGVTSMLYPDSASSLDSVWMLAAVIWGVVFVAVAELTKGTQATPLEFSSSS